jgi:hypothetical protein
MESCQQQQLSKRQKRRRGRRDRQIQRTLENKRAIAIIKQDYNWSAATWGGTKCADCDRRTEPRMQINTKYVLKLPNGRLWGILPVCSQVGNCEKKTTPRC